MTAALLKASVATLQEQISSSKQDAERAHHAMKANELARNNLQKEVQENSNR